MLAQADGPEGGPASFVGRHSELAALDHALGAHRLVTLTGPGGVGKSRLARQALTRRARDATAGAAEAPAAGPRPGEPPEPPAATRPDAPPDPPLGGGGGRQEFPDGIHWADLSPIPDARLLADTVAEALGLADHTSRSLVDAVGEWIGERRLLLVLDCCEHLVPAVRTLAREFLAAAPHLVLLLTSRQPLGLPGEHVMEIGPLPHAAGAGDALVLFRARAAEAAPRTPTPWSEERLAAARFICGRLQGIPLALELAAAQLTDHTVEELADRLARRIGALATGRPVQPPRHRALRTAIGWSHEWCEPRERLLWLRLSVFGGPFDEAAARAVCSAAPLAEADVPPLLAALVAKSVVRRGGDGSYRMLDTIREYGAMWLVEIGERDVLRARHAAHFLALVRRAEREWLGPGQRAGYRRIGAAHGDVCAALDFYLATDPARALDMAGRLGFFWACCGYLHAARAYLERALTAAPPEGVTRAVRARALWALGVTLLLQGEKDPAHQLAVGCEALAMTPGPAGLPDPEGGAYGAARDGGATGRHGDPDADPDEDPDEDPSGGPQGDPRLALDAAYLLGLSHLLAGRPLAARIVAENALDVAPGTPFDSPARLRCHLVRVFALTGMGLFTDARAEAELLRSGCAAREEHWTRAYAHYQLSLISLLESRPAESAAHARAMLESKRELGDSFGTALGLDLLAAARAAQGDGLGAARAYGTGHAYWQAVGHPQRGTPELRAVREEYERTARGALGDRAYEAAFLEGVRHGHALRARPHQGEP
ncbi:regulator [Streptomyces sp. NPDC002138]|uniref:ATP-binding protein n=1 Tax=Streptomyces sp. NPDC002138 TaxID=3154410 RepID=UPI003328A1F4